MSDSPIIKAISADPSDPYVLKLHFNRPLLSDERTELGLEFATLLGRRAVLTEPDKQDGKSL